MKKLLTVLAVAAVGVAPTAAVAHHSHYKTRTLKGSFHPVGADAVYAGVGGKAQLTDNKRRDKLSVHLRHLAPGATYTWSLVSGSCDAPGAPVVGWTYKPLIANSDGNANSNARSKTFSTGTGTYAVIVGSAQGATYACADLHGKKAKKHHHAASHHAAPKAKTHKKGH